MSLSSWSSRNSGNVTVDGKDTQDTGTISPAANGVVFLYFMLGGYTGSGNPTITSNTGLTLGSWTFVDSIGAATGETIYIYRATAGASPGSGTLTIDAEATETWDLINWRVVDCTGQNSSDIVEQVSKLSWGNYAGVLEATWDTAMQSGNGALTIAFTSATSVTWVPRSNWSSLGSRANADGTYYGVLAGAGKVDEDTYFGGTFSGGVWGSAIGIEINAAPSGPSGQVVTTKYHDIQ